MVASSQEREASTILLEKLKLWTERLVKIGMESDRIHCRLADLGVFPKAPFAVGGDDGPRTIRLKERLIEVYRKREDIVRDMATVGAKILDETTMEIALLGGPGETAILSWMPGEPSLGYWRESRDTSCERHPLPADERRGFPPTRH